MIDPTEDGITHVNIYSQGRTELGRMLSNFYAFHIMTEDGPFKSVEGYWYWLGITDCDQKESLRKLSGYLAKMRGSEMKKALGIRLDFEFERKVIKAIWYKVRRNAHLFTGALAALPFEHYYNFGGKIHDVKPKYPWLVDGISKMRDHLLETGQIHD
jgi:hypothetical protein